MGNGQLFTYWYWSQYHPYIPVIVSHIHAGPSHHLQTPVKVQDTAVTINSSHTKTVCTASHISTAGLDGGRGGGDVWRGWTELPVPGQQGLVPAGHVPLTQRQVPSSTLSSDRSPAAPCFQTGPQQHLVFRQVPSSTLSSDRSPATPCLQTGPQQHLVFRQVPSSTLSSDRSPATLCLPQRQVPSSTLSSDRSPAAPFLQTGPQQHLVFRQVSSSTLSSDRSPAAPCLPPCQVHVQLGARQARVCLTGPCRASQSHRYPSWWYT